MVQSTGKGLRKGSTSESILRLVKHVFVDTSVLLRCYYSFVLPIFDYCSPVYGSAAECHLLLPERHAGIFAGQALPGSEFLVGVSLTSCC